MKVTPSLTGITAQTKFGATSLDLPLYAKLLGRSGVSEIALPKGTAEDRISDIFRAVTTRTPHETKTTLENISIIDSSENQSQIPVKWKNYYRSRGCDIFDIPLNPLEKIIGLAGEASLCIAMPASIVLFALGKIPTGLSIMAISTTLMATPHLMARYLRITDKDFKLPFDASNPTTHSKTLAKIARQNKKTQIDILLVKHLNTDVDTLALLACSGHLRVVGKMAFHRLESLNELTPERLVVISKSNDQEVLSLVAKHPNTPAKQVAKLTCSLATHYKSVGWHMETETYHASYNDLGVPYFSDLTDAYALHEWKREVRVEDKIKCHDAGLAELILRAHESAKQEQILDEIAKTDPDWAHRLRSNLGAETNNS